MDQTIKDVIAEHVLTMIKMLKEERDPFNCWIPSELYTADTDYDVHMTIKLRPKKPKNNVIDIFSNKK